MLTAAQALQYGRDLKNICYVGQPEIFPEGFANAGLPVERAGRVLQTLRRERVVLRLQGGEALLHPAIAELARHAKRDLRFWHVSVITNGRRLFERPARAAVERYRPFFATTYVMPVRQGGKTPLPLMKNALELKREFSVHRYPGIRYPERESVGWYREHCDPKIKIKVDASGGLVCPCENHSYSAGSRETHSIREEWRGQAVRYANESCLGCGKQRFRSYAFKRPLRILAVGGVLAEARRVDARPL
jgi:hypothetical protein